MPSDYRNQVLLEGLLRKRQNPEMNPYAALFSPKAAEQMALGYKKKIGEKYPRAEATGDMALQGAKTGTQIYPGWGTVIGALIGGTAGYFLSKPRDRGRTSWS